MFPRYYRLDNFNKDFFERFDFFLKGNSLEERSVYLLNGYKEQLESKLLEIEYDIETEKYSFASEDGSTSNDLTTHFIKDLKERNFDGKSVLIDSTSLKQPILFYLLKILKEDIRPKELFISYTQPKKYKQIDGSESERKFDLTERFCEPKAMPGFFRIPDHHKKSLLVADLGFEGNRFSKAFAEVNPDSKKTYAIVGFPSFNPSWQYYAYSQNINILEQTKSFNLLKKTTAHDPFDIYNVLKAIKKDNEQNQIYIAPLGTKPHSIGICMFAIDNEDIQIFYDFPSHGKKHRTEGIGDTYIYNLTGFINE